jgi:hypothetical protein
MILYGKEKTTDSIHYPMTAAAEELQTEWFMSCTACPRPIFKCSEDECANVETLGRLLESSSSFIPQGNMFLEPSWDSGSWR